MDYLRKAKEAARFTQAWWRGTTVRQRVREVRQFFEFVRMVLVHPMPALSCRIMPLIVLLL
jgi:hypothetical protein